MFDCSARSKNLADHVAGERAQVDRLLLGRDVHRRIGARQATAADWRNAPAAARLPAASTRRRLERLGRGSAASRSSCASMPVSGRAQLMRGVGDELLLRLHRGAQHREQAVQRGGQRRDLARHRGLVDRPQIERRALGDFIAQRASRGRRPSWMPDPYQHQGDVELHEVPQQRAHEAKARRRFGRCAAVSATVTITAPRAGRRPAC